MTVPKLYDTLLVLHSIKIVVKPFLKDNQIVIAQDPGALKDPLNSRFNILDLDKNEMYGDLSLKEAQVIYATRKGQERFINRLNLEQESKAERNRMGIEE